MKRVSLDRLPVAVETRTQLGGLPHVAGALALEGQRTLVYGPGCDCDTLADAQAVFPTATHYWARDEPAGHSNVDKAIALVRSGITPNAAARRLGINSSAVYRAISARKGRKCCSVCGQLLQR